MENEHFYHRFSKASERSLNIEFNMACISGNLEIVKYLSTSRDLDKNVDVNTDDAPFRNAYRLKHLDIVEFLIVNLKMHKTKQIEKDLLNSPNEQVEKWFDIVDLNKNLREELDVNNINENKFKI